MELPATQWMIKKQAGLESKQVNTLTACLKPTHSYILNTDESHCPKCGSCPERASNNTVMLPDVIKYVTKLMSFRKYAHAMKYPLTRERGDGDMWDKLPLNSKTPEEITHTIYLRLSMDATVVNTSKEVQCFLLYVTYVLI